MKSDAVLINRYLTVATEDELVQAFPVTTGPWRSPLKVTQGTIKRLVAGDALTTEDVATILSMFAWRDAYLEELATRENTVGWKPSIFYMLGATCQLPNQITTGNQRSSYCFMYIVFLKVWVLAVLDHDNKQCNMILPNSGVGITGAKDLFWNTLFAANSQFLREWELSDSLTMLLLHQLPEEAVREQDKALALVYIMYSLILSVPVYFEESDLKRKYRENLAYHLTKGNLPY